MSATSLSNADKMNKNWKTISIGETVYAIYAAEYNSTWKISLTNLVDIWTATLDRKRILQICENLNPYLSIDDIEVDEFVRNLFEDIPKYATKTSEEQIDLSVDLEGSTFNFSIVLTKGDPLQVCQQITIPLCQAAAVLQQRFTILLDLIKRKDEEIAEYKLNGADLIRKHIETPKFDENLFEANVRPQNAFSSLNAFQTMMEFYWKPKVEDSSVDPIKTCLGELPATAEVSVKVEAEESSTGNTVDKTAVRNLTCKENSPSKIKSQKSDVIVSKTEKDSSQVSTPDIKSVISDKCKTKPPKRTYSALSMNRKKRTIHDL